MGFELYVKRRGVKVGDYISISKTGVATVNNIKNIEKYKMVKIYVDWQTTEIMLEFHEKERKRYDQESFGIINSKNSYFIDLNLLLKKMHVEIEGKACLPFLQSDEKYKTYVFDLSKYKKENNQQDN